MVEGEIKFESDNLMPNQLNTYMSGIPNSSILNVYQSSTNKPYWEEKTGRKTGFIIKSDEKKTLRIKTYRCISCGFVEIYAIDTL